MAAYFPSHKPSKKDVQEMLKKQRRTHKQGPSVGPHTGTHQFWLTSKSSYPSALSRHWVPSTEPAKSNER